MDNDDIIDKILRRNSFMKDISKLIWFVCADWIDFKWIMSLTDRKENKFIMWYRFSTRINLKIVWGINCEIIWKLCTIFFFKLQILSEMCLEYLHVYVYFHQIIKASYGKCIIILYCTHWVFGTFVWRQNSTAMPKITVKVMFENFWQSRTIRL